MLALAMLVSAPSAVAAPPPAPVVRAAPTVSAVPVVSGLSGPTDVASPPGSTALFVTEKCGRIRAYAGGSLHLVGSLASRVRCEGERGLLSLAFDPDFTKNHWLFVYFTRKDTGDIQVARVTVRQRKIVSGSFRQILRIRHRQATNHNGGKLVFDGAGRLFISVGDGGGGGNQFGHAQDHRSLLGKLLRIDVHHGLPYTIPDGNPLVGTKGRPEIWAIGLRNPWRMALDGTTHALWVADVGQDAVEEIDKVSVNATRLLNFGWSRYEGDRVYDSTERLRGGRLIKPVKTYDHPAGESIIGGAVYRGSGSPSLEGYYVYGDINGWIAGFDTGNPASTFEITPGSSLYTISEAGGELYAGYADGTLYRITAS